MRWAGNKKSNKYAAIALSLVISGFIVWLDMLTGPDTTSLIFYLIPVSLSAWRAGRNAGFSISALCGILWFFTGHQDIIITGMGLVEIWNFTASVGFLIIYSYLLARLKKELEKQIEIAGTDYLTGIYNRLAFVEHVRIEIKRAARNKTPITMVYMDVDNFKKINDRAGHETGDRILCKTGAALKKSLREIDIPARLGGDEFSIIMPQTGVAEVKPFIKRLQKNLYDKMSGETVKVTFSFGVVTFEMPPLSAAKMIREADSLMYRVKKSGKNSVKYKILNKRKYRVKKKKENKTIFEKI